MPELRKLTVALFFSCIVAFPTVAETITGQASVIDGDTIEVHGKRIRLEGIDAPESRQLCTNDIGAEYRCGQVAAFALADKLGRSAVTCEGKKRDRYGRLLATCFAGGVDLNAWMVEHGHAIAYRHFTEAYVPQEEAAKTARRGIWAGTFEEPYLWRRAH
jgi:endonuclease YncB( thermonuclease family)